MNGVVDGWTRVARRAVYSRACGRVVLSPLTSWGYRRHRSTRQTPAIAYIAMRKLFGNPDPALFERLRCLPEQGASLLTFDEPVVGLVAGRIDETVAALDRDGYVVLASRVPEDVCADLEATARAATCALVPAPPEVPLRDRFDERSPRAIRYDLDEEDILASRGAQAIVADDSLLAVAQRYLGATPIQDLVAMWWSAAIGEAASSAAAQLFHFDLDRLKFLKVFVYLTDVDVRTGPHVYVRGTHKDLPARFREDRRYRDDEVLPVFGDAAQTIGGPRGTIFLADTRGLHKGTSLIEGHRLVFQTEYSTSLFGEAYSRPPVSAPTEEFLRAQRRHPQSFERFEAQ